MDNIIDNASRPDLSTSLGFGILSSTIALLCYMLFRHTVSKGVQATRATSPSLGLYTAKPAHGSFHQTTQPLQAFLVPKQPTVTLTPELNAPSHSAGAALAIANMLRGAVSRHEKENAIDADLGRLHSKSLSQTLFTTSQQAQARSGMESSVQTEDSVLKPSSANTLNKWQNNAQRRREGFGGIKRTASGLAKITDGSFDDARGVSRDQPIVVSEDRAPLPRVDHCELFNADDFESDIDLDVEEPIARDTKIKYPSLPKVVSQKPFHPPAFKAQPQKGGAFSPTLPKLQHHQSSTAISESIDSGYGSMPAVAERGRQDLKSSNPLPWSSSPLEHFTPAISRTSASNHPPARDTTQQKHLEAVQQRPPKRRTLPWQGEMKQDHSNASDRQSSATHDTPIASTKTSSFPWNTTASSIKAQQKTHREEAKKASSKTINGAEEAMVAARLKRQKPARVFLSEEQQHVLELVVEKKKSVFFTGSAGTGKSVLLREIISTLRRKHQREPDRIAVTASTGLAACNIGGVTLHSFAGIGLGKEDVPELVRKIKKSPKAKHRWMRTKVLVIDEVSMVDGELFDKLESIARQMRNNGRPFGGIQLVITGDFFQLPPVPDNKGTGSRVARFAFDAQNWKTSIEHTIALHHVFRQKDPVFAGMLNEMREGNLSDASIKTFRSLTRPLVYADSLDATELFPTRGEVDRANQERMSRLQGDLVTYEAKDGGSVVDKMQRDKMLSNCLAPENIFLKKGAQVMLIKNIDETLVNGSLGRVIGFMDEAQFATYHDNEELFAHTQTGTIVDEVGDSLNVGDSEAKMKQRDKLVIGTGPRYPVVRFAIADGTTRDLLCSRESWKIELPNGEVQASRSQVPLILAWALSIHKAQGQTLDRVKVDLGKVFENGQAYVALSRATSMGGLQVLRFDPKKVTAHSRVREFYANLSRIELEKKVDGTKKGKGIKKGTNGGMTADEYERHFMDDEH